MPARKTHRTRRPGEYAAVGTNLLTNPAVIASGKPDSIALAVTSILIAVSNRSDGLIRINDAMYMARVTDWAIAQSLIDNDFFHLEGHTCRRCPQPPDGMAIIHQFLAWNRSSDLVNDLSAERARSGRNGGISRWADHNAAKAAARRAAKTGEPVAPAKANPAVATAAEPVTNASRVAKIDAMLAAAPVVPADAAPAEPRKRGRRAKPKVAAPEQLTLIGNPENTDSTCYPATLTSSEGDTQTNPAHTDQSTTQTKEELEESVDRLCTWFALMIQRSTGTPKPPACTSKSTWRDPMRRIMTVDGYNVEQVKAAIRAGEGSWYRGKTTSPKKLRERMATFHMLATQGDQVAQQRRPRNGYYEEEGVDQEARIIADLKALYGDRYTDELGRQAIAGQQNFPIAASH